MATRELTPSTNATIPPRCASERLILSLLRSERADPAPSDEFRSAVGAYARELRGRGEAPERLLVAVKALLAEAGVRKGRFVSAAGSSPPTRETALYECAVASAIDAYFGPADRGV